MDGPRWLMPAVAAASVVLVAVVVVVVAVARPAGSGFDYIPLPKLPAAAPAPTPEAEPVAQPTGEIALAAQGERTLILMYHDVVERRDGDSVWFDVTPEELEEQIDFIRRRGGNFITFDQLYAHLTTGEPIPERSVLLSFDDNYQGIYDHAIPILRREKIPAIVFVHTAYVGQRTPGSRPKMTWETLQELVAEGLITIGSHTVNHFNDLAEQPEEVQREELFASKEELEARLGVEIPYLSYPNGSNSDVTRALAQEAGYKLAVTMQPTTAEASPSILAVGRYGFNKLEEAWREREALLTDAPASVARIPIRPTVVTPSSGSFGRTRLALITGGRPSTLQSFGRKPVSEFIEESDAIAGINGGFFAMASLYSEDNVMVGPCLSTNFAEFYPDGYAERVEKLRNRPVVLISEDEFAVLPFQPGTMNTLEAFQAFMPKVKDIFVAGAWLVHEGKARTRAQIVKYGAQDVMDPRKRAFLGITEDGRMVLGASLNGATTEQLAQAAARAGVWEAVLLDSGYSTSLVYGDQILAFGHSTTDVPSRPVPHAIVLHEGAGQVDLVTRSLIALQEADLRQDLGIDERGQEAAPEPRRRTPAPQTTRPRTRPTREPESTPKAAPKATPKATPETPKRNPVGPDGEVGTR